jgi:hypothetical protein
MTRSRMDSRFCGNDGKRGCFSYCPIRKISVERRGTRVKKFIVFEAQRAELKNITEYRRSGMPGDFPGAGFLVLFYAKKVLRNPLGGIGIGVAL